jgi:predicted neutral ceramidase superfamily lipid hydrolase
VIACLLAAAPTSLSPSLVKAITEGVVLEPYEFSMTLGVLPSMIATQELVVPRSIPMTAPVFFEEKLANKLFLKTVLIIFLF